MKKLTQLSFYLLLCFTINAQLNYEVLSDTKIANGLNGFPNVLTAADDFGITLANIGDLNNDGIVDLAIGADGDDDGGNRRGAIYILFMNAGNTINSVQKISQTSGGFGGNLIDNGRFGMSIEAIGDLNNDGITELAVGNHWDNDGGTRRGSFWILFMNANGTVASEQKVSDLQGGFTATLDDDDRFGQSIAALGDLNGDNIPDIAVSAHKDDDGGTETGAFYILYLNVNGTVQSHIKIAQGQGGLGNILSVGGQFGNAIEPIGDLNNDGSYDLAVGAVSDPDGGSPRGAVWILFMNALTNTVQSTQKISDTQGGFTGSIDPLDFFGWEICFIENRCNNNPYLAVSNQLDDDGGTDIGAIYILELNTNGTVNDFSKISAIQGNFTSPLAPSDRFGSALTTMGDINNDGVDDISIGARFNNGTGAAWITLMQDSLVIQNTRNLIDDTICNGQSYLFAGNSISAPGTYFDTLINQFGCDSIVELTLTVVSNSVSNLNINICQGSTFIVGSNAYNVSGTYSDTLIGSAGCDSIVNLNLTVSSLVFYNVLDTACFNDNYLFGGNVLTSSGNYVDTFLTLSNCDSVVNLQLYFRPTINVSAGADTTICENVNYFLGGNLAITGMTYAWTAIPSAASVYLSNSNIYNPVLNIATGNLLASMQFVVRGQLDNCSYFDTVEITIVNADKAQILNLDSINTYCPYDTNIALMAIPPGGTFFLNYVVPLPSNSINPTLLVHDSTHIIYYQHPGSLVGCGIDDTAAIFIYPKEQLTLTAPPSICANEIAFFEAGFQPEISTYNWTFTDGNINSGFGRGPYFVEYSSLGNKSITIEYEDGNGCVCDTTFFILVTGPTVETIENQTIRLGQKVLLSTNIKPISDSTDIITWVGENLHCLTCLSPTASPINSGWYYVTVQDSNGCIASDSVFIEVLFDKSIYIPNTFSPNGDNNNDIFFVYGKGIAEIELEIYSRWGEKMFYSNDIKVGWNGTFKNQELNPSVFIYLVKVKYLNNEEESFKGNVTLLR